VAPSPTVFAHEALAVVVQVRDGQLCVLLWRRGQAPHRHRWALPGGRLAADEDLESSIARHLATKVDVTELRHLEQLTTLSAPRRHPGERLVATAFLGLVPSNAEPSLPPDTRWHPTDDLPPTAFDHGDAIRAGVERLRAKLSYTNIGFALAPPTFTISELRELYTAALGYEVSATNLQRVLVRRELLEETGERRPPGPSGGRPATVFRFRSQELEVTDQFAVLRPPVPNLSG
jgi:8-oxo-dGTP diphosphatase